MATIVADSASYAHVAAAVAAASAGDTVTIPAGSATWASTLTYSKAIHLQGNGIGSTVISHAGIAIQVTGAEGAQWTISGIEFTSTGLNSCILSKGNCHNFRIHHCEFNNTDASGIQELISVGDENDVDQQYGVIDNCALDNGRIVVRHGLGDKSWKENSAFGSADAVYIEDCTFTQSNGAFCNSIDSGNGGRYVFRHNSVKDNFLMAHSLLNGSEAYFCRGTRKWEIYENTIEALTNGMTHYIAIALSGGTGVVFNNTVTNAVGVSDQWNEALSVDNNRTYVDDGHGPGLADGSNIIDGNAAHDATCTGAHSGANDAAGLTCAGKTWTPSAYVGMYIYNLTDGSKGEITANAATTVTATLSGGTDNNWDTGDTFKITNGYPACDQIGRGIDASLTPAALPPYDSSYQPQALEPMYAWSNTLDAAQKGVVVVNGCEKHISANRDYYAYNASFDGTTGVGVGLLASRPATCTTGVGYWATDTEILYVATATNTWEPYYTPYTYPHPLRGEGSSPDVITVVSPNGSESWEGGTAHNITWTNTGDTVYENVKIQYSADSGATWTTITASTPNTGSYAWTIPNTTAATYLIKISVVI